MKFEFTKKDASFRAFDTGKSCSEALIIASTNPQYGKRLFIELPVQYMQTTSSEQLKINMLLSKISYK